MKLNVRSFGLDIFKKAVKKFEKELKKDGDRQAKEVANFAANYVKAMVPFDKNHHSKYEHLKATIGVDKVKSGHYFVRTFYKGQSSIFVGAWLEHGWRHAKGGKTMPPKYYLKNGVNLAQDKYSFKINGYVNATWARVFKGF